MTMTSDAYTGVVEVETSITTVGQPTAAFPQALLLQLMYEIKCRS